MAGPDRVVQAERLSTAEQQLTNRSADRQSHGRISTPRDQLVTVPLLPSTVVSTKPSVHSPSAGMWRKRPTNRLSTALKVPLKGLKKFNQVKKDVGSKVDADFVTDGV